jgi:hypothetical protein
MRSPARIAVLLLLALTACQDLAAPSKDAGFRPEPRLDFAPGLSTVQAGDTMIVSLVVLSCYPNYWWDPALANWNGVSIDFGGAVSGGWADMCNNYDPYGPRGIQAPVTMVASASGTVTMTITDPRFGTGPCYNPPNNPGWEVECKVGGQVSTWAGLNIQVKRAYPPPDSVQLDCQTHTPTRGQSVTCTASLSGQAPLQSVLGWEFWPNDTTLPQPIRRQGTSSTTTTWAGTIAASGMVVVSTLSNGIANWTFNVKARPWGQPALPRDKTYLGLGPICPLFCKALTDPPQPPGDSAVLGQTIPQIDTLDLRTGYNRFQMISGGPNDSLSYALSVPGPVHFKMTVDTLALRDSSKFWLQQANPGVGRLQPGACDRSVVTELRPLALQHEGVAYHQYSHYETYYEGFLIYYVPAIEGLVQKGLPSTTTLWAIGYNMTKKAKAHSDSITENPALDPAYHKCKFK